MIMIDNKNSEIILCSGIKLDKNYENVLSYNEEQMVNLCRNNSIYTAREYSFIGNTNFIDIECPYQTTMYSNYVAFLNPTFGDKWMFGWVTDVKLINPKTSRIFFEIDVFSTWYSRFNVGQAFIEREHVDDDAIGLHTLPENLEIGDYVLNARKENFLSDVSNYVICMAVTELPNESVPPYTNNRVYNGIFGGLYYLAFDSANDCQNAITIYDILGKADAINSLFMIPKNMASYKDATSVNWSIPQSGETNVSASLKYLTGSNDVDTLGNININMPTKLGSNYTPINNKLFTYPYCFFNLTNNSGITETFRYEDFTKENDELVISFWVDATITPGMSIKAIPLFYKNENINYNYGIMGGKLPVCSYNSDVYLNWLRQNGLNSVFNVISGVISSAGGIGSGNIGSAVGGLSSIYNAVHQYTVADITPNQSKGNTNSGDVNFSDEDCGLFTVYKMSIKEEYAIIIDRYFSRFGYKVNIVKTPNLNSRAKFNFIKVGGMDELISGNIPASDLEKINSLFRKGITIFHDYNAFGDYTISNPIVKP